MTAQETFEDFKNSFSYGSRTDLNFKFLAALEPDQAARFFQDLLWKLGDSFNDGDYRRIVEHVLQAQISGYSSPTKYTYPDGPFFTPPPISKAKLALISSSGHFVSSDDPQPFGEPAMSQEEAVRRINDFVKSAPTLSVIPKDTPNDNLRVRHGGFDVRGPQRDPNTAFPLEQLRHMERDGLFGSLAAQAYSFMGVCAQTRLLKQSGPRWVGLLKDQNVDIALLVPV